MKALLLPFIIIFSIHSFSQEQSNETATFSILLGPKLRVTPIYIGHVPDVIFVRGLVDNLQQPDIHLSGLAFYITERFSLENKVSFSLHQSIRKDYVYQKQPLDYPPPAGFIYSTKEKVIIDLYVDIAKELPAKKSYFRLLLGIGVCGLNTRYNETLRIYQNSTTYTDYHHKRNFVFPAITSGLGWQKKNFYTELKMGYCWSNPTLFDTPFLFPEITCQYQFRIR